jgi:lipoprotein-anchoring transpeptidase ErfK/SrfK
VGGIARPVRSVLNIKKALDYGDFVWNERDIPPGRTWIRVDPKSQLISIFRAGHEIGTAVILYGAAQHQTPAGIFPIQWKKEHHRSATYDAPMPFTLRLTEDGVAIHGAEVKWGAATHGCIGVPLGFAKLLYGSARAGDEVVILADRPKKVNQS